MKVGSTEGDLGKAAFDRETQERDWSLLKCMSIVLLGKVCFGQLNLNEGFSESHISSTFKEKKNEGFKVKTTIPAVKHGRGSVMLICGVLSLRMAQLNERIIKMRQKHTAHCQRAL